MGDEEFVHNHIVERGLAGRLPEKMLLWDETMRDGEQTPGVAFTPEEKVRIATLLDEMGVPLMDVGIPVVSKAEARGARIRLRPTRDGRRDGEPYQPWPLAAHGETR